MARHARLIGLFGALLLIGATAPADGALASTAPTAVEAAPAPGAVCPLQANTDLRSADVVVATPMDVLANDCLGAATPTRPLVITAVTQGTYGSVTHDGRTVVYNPAACRTGNADGNDFFTYTITDGSASRTGTVIVSFARPTASPVTDAPSAGFMSGTTIGSTIKLRLSWCGVPTSGASVSGYRVQQSTNGGTSYASTPVYSGAATASVRTVRASTSYRWQVRTTDSRKGGGPYAPSLVSRILSAQDNGGRIAYSSGWKTASSTKFSGGKSHYVTRSGATATLTVSGVRQFAIVASRGRGRGAFHVYVDGRRVTTSAISQRSSTSFRRILYVGGIPGDTAATHTIQVRTANRYRVDLDTILTLSGKQTPALSISTPASATYGEAPAALVASATSGLPATVTVAQDSWGVCALSGTAVAFNGAGTCTLIATHAADPSWNGAAASRSFTVAPKPLTVTGIIAIDRAYNGTTSAGLNTDSAALAGKINGDDVSLVTGGATGTFADANAGSAKSVTVSGLSLAGARAANYALSPLSVSATITKANQAITITSARPEPAVKGGSSYTVAATATSGLPPTVTVEATPAGACTIGGNVVSFPASGSCTVLVNQPGDGNWNAAAQALQTITVASTGSTTQTIAFDKPADTEYRLAPVALSTSASSGLGVILVSQTPGVCTTSGATAILHAAGACTIEAQQPGDSTYRDAVPVSQGFTVAPKPLTVSGITADNKTYDGTTTASLATGSAALSGVINADDVSLGTGGATGTFADPNAGPGKSVAVSGLSLGGATAGSYTLNSPSVSATIAKRALTVRADGKEMIYGAVDPGFTVTYGAFVGGETLEVIDAAPTCSAGPTRDVSGSPYTIGCTGGSDNNYAFSFVAGQLTVTAKPVIVTFTASGKTYSGTVDATITACSISVVVGSDDATCSFGLAAATFDSANVGAGRTVTGIGFTIAGAKASNYTIAGINTSTASITRATPVCEVAGYSVTYDGNPHTATGTCTGVGFADLSTGLDLSATTHVNAGVYSSQPWAFTDVTGNYQNAAGTVTVTIAQALQAISFTSIAPAPATAGVTAYTATATGGLSGNPVVFSSGTESVCTVAAGGVVDFLAEGTCTIRANQAASTNYAAAPQATQDVIVASKLAQTIDFGPLGGHQYGDSFSVSATSSSLLIVSFDTSTTPTVCSVSGGTVTVIDTGPCMVTATQAGDDTYAPASPVSRSFTATSRAITVTAVTDSKVADGTNASGGTPTLTLGSLVGSDVGTYAQTFDSASAASGKTITPSATIQNGLVDVTARYAITPFTATGTITPAAAANIILSPASTLLAAGDSVSFIAEAFDQYSNSRGDVTGTTTFDMPGGSCTGPLCSATATGSYTVTGTYEGIEGFANVDVHAGAATHLVVTASSPQVPGILFNVTVTAKDAFNNTATGYIGEVTFTTGTATASLPADYTFVPGDGGTRTFSLSLDEPGAWTITVTDTGNGSITGSSAGIDVN
ncbi:MAG TPA: YDG domain-containing protein [Candidatus Limnocylindrales bacterium]|nr:YDG domain-containing protein [Candidatus Limnocylindrales bacterium]